jgi:hypothetical protein
MEDVFLDLVRVTDALPCPPTGLSPLPQLSSPTHRSCWCIPLHPRAHRPSLSSRLLLLGLDCGLLALWHTREIQRLDEAPRTLVDDDVVCLLDVGQDLDVLLFDGVGPFHDQLVDARGAVLVDALYICQRAFASISNGVTYKRLPHSVSVGQDPPKPRSSRAIGNIFLQQFLEVALGFSRLASVLIAKPVQPLVLLDQLIAFIRGFSWLRLLLLNLAVVGLLRWLTGRGCALLLL